MHLSSLVEMVESGFDDRVLLRDGDRAVTGAELGLLVRRGAATLAGRGTALVYASRVLDMLESSGAIGGARSRSAD